MFAFGGADSTDRRNTLRFQSDTMERYAYGGACTDMVHAEAEGRTLGALEVRQMGGVRRPGARGTRAVSKILVLNGGIVSAPHRRALASSVASTG